MVIAIFIVLQMYPGRYKLITVFIKKSTQVEIDKKKQRKAGQSHEVPRTLTKIILVYFLSFWSS